MDDVRVGRIARALRRRLDMTQAELGRRCGLSQQAISLVERGHGSRLSGATMRRVFGALDARWDPVVSWRGGELDRLLDERHAAIVAETVARVRGRGWQIDLEVTYSVFGERGSLDGLAWREAGSVVLVVEVKSELTSLEGTLRKLDEKVRLVRTTLARDRFGPGDRTVSRLLILPATSVARRQVFRAGAVLDAALPQRGADVRDWLRRPVRELRGIWFVPVTNRRSSRNR
jgi:transcriptional regulator with XRE-family HTH domain